MVGMRCDLTGFSLTHKSPSSRTTPAPITLRQLLTHKAGLGYAGGDPDYARWARHAGADTRGGELRGHHGGVGDARFKFPPGQRVVVLRVRGRLGRAAWSSRPFSGRTLGGGVLTCAGEPVWARGTLPCGETRRCCCCCLMTCRTVRRCRLPAETPRLASFGPARRTRSRR